MHSADSACGAPPCRRAAVAAALLAGLRLTAIVARLAGTLRLEDMVRRVSNDARDVGQPLRVAIGHTAAARRFPDSLAIVDEPVRNLRDVGLRRREEKGNKQNSAG